MRDDEELDGIEEILPDDIRRSTERRERIEESLRHPHTEGCVFLFERLSGGDGADARHGLGCSRRVNEHILVVASFAGGRHVIADQFAETELQQAGDEG